MIRLSTGSKKVIGGCKMSYEMKLEQGLSQQLNQFQVQSLKILSFDNYELEKFL